MKKLIALIMVLVATSASVFACGAPQDIYGRVDFGDIAERDRGALVELYIQGDKSPIAIVRLNPWSWYRFNSMTPCNDYTVWVRSDRAFFAPMSFTLYGHLTRGQRVDLFGESLK